MEQLALWKGKDGHDNAALYAGHSLISGRVYEWRFVSLAIARGMMQAFGPSDQTVNDIDSALAFEVSNYSRQWLPAFAPVLDAFVRKDKGETRILEIGSGVGLNAYVLSSYGRVTAMELDKERWQWSVESWKGLGVSHLISHRCEDVLATRLPAASFDVIVTVTMFQHLCLRDKLATIEKIKRLLRPGGVAMMHEGRIFDEPLETLDTRYRRADWAAHMVPISLSLLSERFMPFRVEQVSGLDFIIHHPERRP